MILLDTPALVWAVSEPRKLSRPASAAIRRARGGGGIAIAAITLWEIAVLIARGHLVALGTIDDSIRLILETSGASVRPLTPQIAALATQFPEDFPRDPADRLIVQFGRIDRGLASSCGAVFEGVRDVTV